MQESLWRRRKHNNCSHDLMMKRDLSVIICTFNRAHYLRKAIHSLLKQTLPPETFEILVVDNGSTDETCQMMTEEFDSVTNLRYLYEPTPGLSHARNTGWKHAQGDYVAYLDDDAIAVSDWCHNILNVFKSYEIRPGCVGGRVAPIWESSCPHWVSVTMQHYLSSSLVSNSDCAQARAMAFRM